MNNLISETSQADCDGFTENAKGLVFQLPSPHQYKQMLSSVLPELALQTVVVCPLRNVGG